MPPLGGEQEPQEPQPKESQDYLWARSENVNGAQWGQRKVSVADVLEHLLAPAVRLRGARVGPIGY